MSNRLPWIIVVLVVLLGLAYSSFFVVQAGYQAIVLRFGKIQSVKTEPGIYFKLPFSFIEADNCPDDPEARHPVRPGRHPCPGIGWQVLRGGCLRGLQDHRCRERFRETVSGDYVAAEQRLRTRLDSALRRVYGLRGFEAALSDARAAMMTDVRDQLRPDASALGLTIEDVRIRRTDLTQEVSQQTYDRMKAERLAEAELIRARGREAGQRIRAIADRQVVELESQARRDSEITRGEGDAERNRIFAEAFSKDEGFFDFYRSMEAYRQSLTNSDTTMVISPNSEFFRFFQDAAGTVPGADGRQRHAVSLKRHE